MSEQIDGIDIRQRWLVQRDRIAALEAAVLRLLEAGAGICNPADRAGYWELADAWDEAARAAKTAMGAKITPLK